VKERKRYRKGRHQATGQNRTKKKEKADGEKISRIRPLTRGSEAFIDHTTWVAWGGRRGPPGWVTTGRGSGGLTEASSARGGGPLNRDMSDETGICRTAQTREAKVVWGSTLVKGDPMKCGWTYITELLACWEKRESYQKAAEGFQLSRLKMLGLSSVDGVDGPLGRA